MPHFDRSHKTRLMYLSTFLVFIFGFEYLTRHFIWNVSLNIIPWMQSNLNLLIPFEHFFSFFGTERVMIIILFVFYNFFNIYKTFILISVISIANFTTGLLKMLYCQARPYWVSQYIIPHQCEAGWANPSGHSLCSVAFYLTMWKLIFYEKSEALKQEINQERREEDKNIWLFIIILVISFISIGRLILGVHGLNQIILGCSLGYAIYYFTFHIMNINPDDPYQLINLISHNLAYLFLTHFGLFIGYTWIFFTIAKSNPNKALYNSMVDSKGCSSIGYGKRFENDAYLNCTLLHFYLAALIGIKTEYYYIFKSNMKKWIEYNFGHQLNEETEGLLQKNYDHQWNHTEDFVVTVKRISLTMFFFFLTTIPYSMISYNANMLVIVLFKILIPPAFSLILLFSYFKLFLGYFEATKKTNKINAGEILVQD